ncbi:rab-GTPase-TBC domain-containing protein [Bisporella sp. PMI_857]|nr:rab-GTPase-TBC domain-containing protein [Bisporella sp. PMI_857]
MRTLGEAKARWEYTINHALSLEDLKKSVRLDGDESPCKAGLRSVCWKIFLLFQTTEVTGWSRILKDSRGAYSSLREHLLRYIENPDELGSALDPLDDDRHSPWNTLRRDEEIRAEIFQDVERCMPEEPYFRQPDTQRLMLDILFIFCKINQDVGYRQGMHEILAPILWVVEHDALGSGSKVEQTRLLDDALLKETLDLEYIEHDAFTILSLIMRTAKSFYELGEPEKRSSVSSSGLGATQHNASPIVERSKRIHEVYLSRIDPELSKHITDIEVLPQIFLIRWIRLLFGREFPFEELLELWDTLFSEDPALELVDMICVAMLLRIRWQLIEANYSVALMLLLKYPAPSPLHGPQTFVDDAIFLRDNFSAAGGAEIIGKYSGKYPFVKSPDLRPSTPLSRALSPGQKNTRTRSPLSSPARFLQQQGGVEALLQGAARGVFDRGERLGINQAVRDAVGEVKKNMQGLQVSRTNSASSRRTSDAMRWSLDEGRSVSSSKVSLAAINNRNQQLARMLEQATAELRTASAIKDGDKGMYVNAIDLAIAKVDFVKIYLEDLSMPLPADQPELDPSPSPATSSLLNPTSSPTPKSRETQEHGGPMLLQPSSIGKNAEAGTVPIPSPAPEIPHTNKEVRGETAVPEPSIIIPKEKVSQPDSHDSVLGRPKAPVPTRSTIANSSFSWMLDTDDSPALGLGFKAVSPAPNTPFLKSGRKPISGPSRERAAFLFGEDGGELQKPESRSPLLVDPEQSFDLKTIHVKGRNK